MKLPAPPRLDRRDRDPVRADGVEYCGGDRDLREPPAYALDQGGDRIMAESGGDLRVGGQRQRQARLLAISATSTLTWISVIARAPQVAEGPALRRPPGEPHHDQHRAQDRHSSRRA